MLTDARKLEIAVEAMRLVREDDEERFVAWVKSLPEEERAHVHRLAAGARRLRRCGIRATMPAEEG